MPNIARLFNICIDDLLDEIKSIKVEGLENGLKGLLFAEDTVITAESMGSLIYKNGWKRTKWK